jgi:hypothetical protein
MTAQEFIEYMEEGTFLGLSYLIKSDGDIVYVRWGHTNQLYRESRQSQEEIDKIMPISAAPIFWMTDYVGSITGDNDYAIFPNNPTSKQIDSFLSLLNKIKENDKIKIKYKKPYSIYQCFEMERCRLLELFSQSGKFRYLGFIPDRKVYKDVSDFLIEYNKTKGEEKNVK